MVANYKVQEGSELSLYQHGEVPPMRVSRSEGIRLDLILPVVEMMVAYIFNGRMKNLITFLIISNVNGNNRSGKINPDNPRETPDGNTDRYGRKRC